MSDAEWSAGHARAQAQGQTLTDILRKLLSGYLVGQFDDPAYRTEYRAVPKNADGSLAVDGITGTYEEVRRLYPAKHWTLQQRTVSPYTSTARR
jgi:hypothetical protein